MYNEKLVDNLNKCKVFKKHVFHHDNIKEKYYWDDYDTTYGYKINTLANCIMDNKTKQISSCLPKPQATKILLLSNSSTQTSPNVYPEYYFPGTNNYFTPFFANFKIAK